MHIHAAGTTNKTASETKQDGRCQVVMWNLNIWFSREVVESKGSAAFVGSTHNTSCDTV